MRAGLSLVLLSGLLLGCSSDAPPTSASTPPPPSATRSTTASPDTQNAAPRVSLEARGIATDILTKLVTREAGDPANAWALAHGMLALGGDFKARDGRLALRVLADDFLESDTFGPMFAKARGDRPVEPHTDLILKTLLERGFGLTEELKSGVSVGDLLAASRARFAPLRTPDRLRFVSPNDAPWSVQAWCQGAAADRTQGWESVAGSVTIDEVAAAQLNQLEVETHFIRQALASGTPFEKRKQGIFAYTCGGAHLFAGAASCATLGWPKQGNSAARIALQVEQYLARVPVETGLVDAALRQNPQLAVLLHNQDIKFLGHLIEGLSKLQRDGLWVPSPAQASVLDDAEARLIANVIALERAGAYSPPAMAQFSANPQVFQLYLDLVGDAAHALHGLSLRGSAVRAP